MLQEGLRSSTPVKKDQDHAQRCGALNDATMDIVQKAVPEFDLEAVEKTKKLAEAYKTKSIMAYPVIKNAADWYAAKADSLRQEARTKYVKKLKEELNEQGGKAVKKIIKRIDKVQAQPIMYLKRDREGIEGQSVGTYTTDPKEIDGIVMRAWKKIYEGTKDNVHKAAELFIKKYGDYIYQGNEFHLE